MRSNFATFYDVDPQYINYLKQIDPHIMNVEYANRNKFVYGVVLETSDKVKYYVPVSHYSANKENNILIKIEDHKRIVTVGSLRFNYMFPVPEFCLSSINFKNSNHFDTDEERIKVEKEYRYIKKVIGIRNIQKMAKLTYDMVVNYTNTELTNNSCNFKILEKAYWEYIRLNASEGLTKPEIGS